MQKANAKDIIFQITVGEVEKLMLNVIDDRHVNPRVKLPGEKHIRLLK